MLTFLAEQPLLTLFLIMAVGLAIGKINFFGISLGAAAAMFVALGLSAANPDIAIPPFVYQFGLAIFVYIIGLNFGRSFFQDFRRRGWKMSAVVVIFFFILAGLTVLFVRIFDLDPAIGVGTLAGSLSSTPGMAAVVEALNGDSTPVVGYSLAYPGCIIGTILVAAIGAKVFRVNHVKDAKDEGMLSEPLEWKAVRLTKDPGVTVGELPEFTGEKVIATRCVRTDNQHELADPDMRVREGMELLLNGTGPALDRAIALLGKEIDLNLHEKDGLIYRRVTVSNPQVAGRTIEELDTMSHGFLIARIRRGDTQIVPNDNTVLYYSDRVRVVTAPGRLNDVRDFLGDSESKLGNLDLFPFALGLLLGLLFGAIPIPLPGGTTLSFGFGGGPIVVGLILGAIGRTGPIHWQMPFHSKQTISTLGLTLFLAGVGTSAGGQFRDAMSDPTSLKYMGVGIILSLVSAIGLGVVCTLVLRLKFDEAMGVAAGMTTNPAIMAYLNPQTGTQLAERGYATVYPTTMIGKILMCQMLALIIV